MTHPSTDRDDDFLPSDWTTERPGGQPISADFVERTLQRVLDDQAEIAAEAARVDDVRFPRDLLDAFEVPAISPDFAGRVASRVQRQADDAAAERDTAADWADALETFSPPEPSEAFVERTLLALKVERSPLRLVSEGSSETLDPESASPSTNAPSGAGIRRMLSPARVAAFLSAAAALLVFVLPIGREPGTTGDGRLTTAARFDPARIVQTYSPVSWSTGLTRFAAESNDELVFHLPTGARRGDAAASGRIRADGGRGR